MERDDVGVAGPSVVGAPRQRAGGQAQCGRRERVLDRDPQEAPPSPGVSSGHTLAEDGGRLGGAPSAREAADEAKGLVVPPPAHLAPEVGRRWNKLIQSHCRTLFL